MTHAMLTERPRISLPDLARRECVHLSTAWRWCLRGVGGHRLESISIGQRRYTTGPAYERWINIINGGTAAANETPRQRERAMTKAEERLSEYGVIRS